MKKILFMFLIVMITALSFFCQTLSAKTLNSKISAVMLQGGTVYISLYGDALPSYNCNSNMLHIMADNPDNKKLYSLVLTAASQQKEVAITFNETSPLCEVDTILVYF